MTLETEIATDPLGRVYSGMSDQQVADDLNSIYSVNPRTRIRTVMTGDEVFQQTDATEFSNLTDSNKQLWLAFCARDLIDPSAAANVAFVQSIFGSATTVANLNAARTETVSRAAELGLAVVGEGDVWDVRNA